MTPPGLIKGIERVVPMLKFSLLGLEIRVHGLELLHDNMKKYGTMFNTVAPGTDLRGVVVRTTSHQP